MKLSTLIKSAQRSTASRGHRMKWGSVYGRADGPKSRNAECRKCGAFVTVHESPAPNQIDIGGEAVAVNCPRLIS
jgi:hypothetical protein